MNEPVLIDNTTTSSEVIRSEDAQSDFYFKLHQRINARSEEISKNYSNNILVKFEDIRELHLKTLQSITSLKPAKSIINTRISVSHLEGESEKFNSFEAFAQHNVTSPNATTDISLTYSFSLFDQEDGNFENYKVINQISSRVAQLHQLEKQAPPFISEAIISGMVTDTAKITVHYSDYVKARHFFSMFDEWIKGCDESKNSEKIRTLKKYSYLIPRVGKFIIYALLAWFTANAIDSNTISTDFSIKFIVLYASVFVITGGISDTLLRLVERAIDSHLAISYLDINKGDKKLIQRFNDRNKRSIRNTVTGLAGTLILGISTSAAYDAIKWIVL